jgi:hypothetical protein
VGLEEDLGVIERSIRELQIDWEKFFSGIERRPPNEAKARLEALIRKHAGAEVRNNTLRFRYQTLAARYTSFNELWSKRLRALEEGRNIRGVRVPGAGAAAVPQPPPDEPVTGESADEISPLEALLGGPAPPPRPKPRPQHRVADPARDQATVRALFDQFLEARRQTGEGGNVKFESFQKLITQQAARILQDKGAAAVDFRLETKDGKVSLKAKPVK